MKSLLGFTAAGTVEKGGSHAARAPNYSPATGVGRARQSHGPRARTAQLGGGIADPYAGVCRLDPVDDRLGLWLRGHPRCGRAARRKRSSLGSLPTSPGWKRSNTQFEGKRPRWRPACLNRAGRQTHKSCERGNRTDDVPRPTRDYPRSRSSGCCHRCRRFWEIRSNAHAPLLTMGSSLLPSIATSPP